MNQTTIGEVKVGKCWHVRRGGKTRKTRTAIEALELVKKLDQQEAKRTGKTVTTVLTWETRTAVGAAVVKAITGGAR